MLNRNKKQVMELISEYIDVNQDMFHTMMTTALEKLLTDKKFLKEMAAELSLAEARRISANRERKLEELSEKELEMRDSPEPWFDMMMLGHDPERGAAIKIEWNAAFIKYLEGLGYKGVDDEQTVQHYIGLLGAESMVSDYEL